MGLIFVMLLISLVSAVEENHEEIFKQAQEIIQQKIPCEELTESQLEILGDYYMEQMHPGEVHERMDAMMGGEGSESLKQVHINMGLRFYCGNQGSLNYGMMGYGSYGGMMQGGSYYNNSNNYWNFTSILFNVLLIVLIILTVVWILKISRKKMKKSGRSKNKK